MLASASRPGVAPWRAYDPRGERAQSQAPKRSLIVVAFQALAEGDGGLRSLTEILRRLRTFRPTVVTQRESAFTAEWRALGFDVIVWPTEDQSAHGRVRRWVARGQVATLHNRRMRQLVRQLDCQVVHCNDLHALMHTAIGARAAGAKVLFNIRSTQGVQGVKWRSASHLADQVVVLSSEMAAHLDAHLPPLATWPRRAPVRAIYSIVDLTRLRPAPPEERARLRRELGIHPGEFAVGVVGVLHPRKQQLELLEYLRQDLFRLPQRLRFHFVGEVNASGTDYGRRCEALLWSASAEFRQRVRLVGFERAMQRWYQALDCVLVPSAHEGLARAMIEALACGCPVVSFDVCSAREILEQHGAGIVARQGDYAGLLAACARLASDAALRERLADSGARAAVRLFAADQAVRAYEDCYHELLARVGR